VVSTKLIQVKFWRKPSTRGSLTRNTVSDLPSPPTNVVLKHIALGHGIQNYTCTAVNAPGATVTPTAKGALAVLYDTAPFYPGAGPDALPDVATFQTLGSTVLWTQPLPLNMNESTIGRVLATANGATSTNPFPTPADLVLPEMNPIPYLGFHYFDSAGTPSFVAGSDFFSGGKLNGTNAPAGADIGPAQTGVVQWLKLGGNAASRGVTIIYRVVTAGGVGHPCTAIGEDSVPYTAFYWMFGPAS
jgi:hypothetical protein